MAKKTRGGGHHQQRRHRPAASSRVSTSHVAAPAGAKGMDRRVVFGLVAVVVVVLLGSVLVLGRGLGPVAAPTDPPITTPISSPAG